MMSGGGRKKIKYQKSNIKIVESAFGGGCFYGSSLWGRVDVGSPGRGKRKSNIKNQISKLRSRFAELF